MSRGRAGAARCGVRARGAAVHLVLSLTPLPGACSRRWDPGRHDASCRRCSKRVRRRCRESQAAIEIIDNGAPLTDPRLGWLARLQDEKALSFFAYVNHLTRVTAGSHYG